MDRTPGGSQQPRLQRAAPHGPPTAHVSCTIRPQSRKTKKSSLQREIVATAKCRSFQLTGRPAKSKSCEKDRVRTGLPDGFPRRGLPMLAEDLPAALSGRTVRQAHEASSG